MLAPRIDTLTQVAVVIESGRNALSLYVNGALNATTTLTRRLKRSTPTSSP